MKVQDAGVAHDVQIMLLLLMCLLGVFPLDVLLPSVPVLAQAFFVEQEYIAYTVSAFAVGVAVFQLWVGPLSDRTGRKPLLIAGLLVSITGATGCVLASNYEGFLAFRLLQAAGCSCFVLS